MKLLFKAFVQRQLKTVSLLVFLSFLVLVSIQVTTTIWTKDLTLVNRINQVNGTHTYIMSPPMNRPIATSFGQIGIGADQFEALIDHYQLTSRQSLQVERSFAFPFTGDYDIFVLGYTSEDQSNDYEVIEGKALADIEGFEVAITESYARQLKKDGTNPLQSTLTFEIANQTFVFNVVSIIDFVNFNDAYVSDKGLKDIPLFDYPFTSVAYGNYETIKSLSSEFQSFSKEVLQVRFDDYSRRAEENLVTSLLNSYRMDVENEKIIASYEITDYLSTNELLYKHVSMFSLIGFILATAYSFVVFIKRQLKQNASNIGVMSILGLEDKKIKTVFRVRLFVIFFAAFALFIMLNAFILLMFKNDRSLVNVIDINSIIFSISILAASSYFLVITLIYNQQISKTIKTSFSSIKTKQQTFIKNPQTRNATLPAIIAFKSLFAHKGFFASSLLVISLLMFTLFSNIAISSQISEIYNEQTLGVKFDYLIQEAPFSQFEFTGQYATDQVMIEKRSDLYFVDIDYSEYHRSYYKGNMLIFWHIIEPFVDIVEGEAPPDWRQIYSEFPENYRFALASRKHMDVRNAYVYNDENIAKYKQPERGYLFYSIPHLAYNSQETAATISGTVNTLIDNGWIMYVYRKRQMIEVGVPYLPMYLTNLKDDVDHEQFELAMQSEGINYISFKQVVEMLNNANKENQQEIFYFMSFIIGLLSFVLIVNVIAYTLIQSMENKKDYTLFKQIGIKPKIHRKIVANQYLLYALLAFVISQVFFSIGYPILLDGVLKAYGLYFTTQLNTVIQYSISILIAVLLIVIGLMNIPEKVR
jgi:hypothetical protein